MSDAESAPEAERKNLDSRTLFVLALGRALHQQGAPSHRVEAALVNLSRLLGLEGEFFAAPTMLISTFEGQSSGSHIDRLEPRDVNLSKLAALDELAQAVASGKTTVREGRRAIERILETRSPYTPLTDIGAFAIASATATRLFGGGANEALVALFAGAAIGVLAFWAPGVKPLERTWQILGAFLAGFVATVLSSQIPLSVPITALSSLIVLVPGLTLTIAISELSRGMLVAGTSRLSGAVLSLSMLAFGTLLGQRLGALVAGPSLDTALGQRSPPFLSEVPAALLTALAFVVLLKAARKDLLGILVTGLATWATARALSMNLEPEIAALGGAFVAGALSNLYARIRNRPVLVTRVAATLLLVPGSLGFRGLYAFLEHDALRGLEAVTTVAFIAIAIVTGFLFSGALVPARRVL